jgi:hypothetical protein
MDGYDIPDWKVYLGRRVTSGNLLGPPLELRVMAGVGQNVYHGERGWGWMVRTELAIK